MDSQRRRSSMFLLAALSAGCTSADSLTHGRGASGAGGSRGGSSGAITAGAAGRGLTGGQAGTGGGVIVVPDASVVDAPGSDATCAGSVTEARLIPLDLFIMLDQSTSMGNPVGNGNDTRWGAVTKAIGSFVQQPEASGLGVGINYFGIPLGGKPQCAGTQPTCMNDADCAMGCGPCVPFMAGSSLLVCTGVLGGAGPDMCAVASYAKAETPIAPLPGNAQAILDSLARHMPGSSTPTSAALQGSVDFSRQWATAHPDRVVVNVFATDGEPAACDTNSANIIAIAANGFSGMPSIRTFAIGVGDFVDAGTGPRALLGGIAQAGGTMQAFIVSDADVNRQFLMALNKIQGAALACAYTIPDAMGRQPDYNKVNVRYTPGGSTTSVVIPKVANAADCANRDGWYYDDNAHPARILVCDATCQKFSMDSKGKVEIEVGCATIIAPPR